MEIILPVQLNPISRRKDRSVKLSFETRELQPNEILSLMTFEGSEMWLLLSSVEAEIAPSDVPDHKPELGTKSRSERLKNALYVWYKQCEKDQTFIGDFETFLNIKLDAIIEGVKSKLHE